MDILEKIRQSMDKPQLAKLYKIELAIDKRMAEAPDELYYELLDGLSAVYKIKVMSEDARYVKNSLINKIIKIKQFLNINYG